MSKKIQEMLILLTCLIIVCVSSDSVQHQAPTADNGQNLREESQLMKDSYDGLIDLHDQIQSLTYANAEQSANDEPPHNSWSALVSGTPGTDYPNLNQIPGTSFSCADKTPGGYYADVETGCLVFHICNIGGLKSSFLCPEGSIFNQRHFVCDWWYGFNCNDISSLYPEDQPEKNQTNEQTESIDTPSSKSIDNYEPIEFRNDSPKDLALASSGEGGSAAYTQKRLAKDNQREPLSDEQRKVAHHNEKLDRKLKRNYVNGDAKFHQYPLTNKGYIQLSDENSKNLESHRGKEVDESSIEVTMEREYFSNANGYRTKGLLFQS